MPPIRTQVVTRSRKEREQNFVSPSRGRGRKRRTQRHHAHQTTPARAISNVAGIGTSTTEMDHHCLTEDFAGQPGISPEPVPDSGESDIIIPHIDHMQSINFDGPNFDIQEYQPCVTTSTFDPISSHVPQKMKIKIWEDQFIDLSLLLKSARELVDHVDTQGQIQIRNGTMCLVKQKSNSFLSIEKWTSAFIIFTSIILEKYRTRSQELLKYMRDIRIAASRSSGWFKYDEQFRLQKVANPHSSWGQINSELWLLYITNNTPSQVPDKFSQQGKFMSTPNSAPQNRLSSHY